MAKVKPKPRKPLTNEQRARYNENRRRKRSEETPEERARRLNIEREKRSARSELVKQKDTSSSVNASNSSKKSSHPSSKNQKTPQTKLAQKRTPEQTLQNNAKRRKMSEETPEQRKTRLLKRKENRRVRLEKLKQSQLSVFQNRSNEQSESSGRKSTPKPSPIARMQHNRISQKQNSNKANQSRQLQLRKRRQRAKARSLSAKKNKETNEQRTARLKKAKEKRLAKSRERLPKVFLGRKLSSKPEELYLGKMDKSCPFCNAFHFAVERNSKKNYSTCCEGGHYSLKPLRTYPEPFFSWLSNIDDPDFKHFRENCRKYNNAFAFASFGYQPVKFKGGPPTFAIHGQVYHLTTKSLTANIVSQKYAQLYFLDPEFANETRLRNSDNDGCKKSVMEEIDVFLRRNNSFARAYQMMKEVVQRTGSSNVHMSIVKDPTYDRRRYNPPVEKNEVAAVFTTEDGLPEDTRDVCVHLKGTNWLQHINTINPICDPMTYPILFPYGDHGWQPGLKRNTQGKRNQISQQEFYSYLLQERTQFNPILQASKITQQYIIDSFLKIEGCRLNWCRQNQQKLRVDSYLGLMDFVQNQAQQKNLKPGKVCILPSSFTGSKRAMQQSYQDAMTMVAVFGKPDLFITFTCNPKWKEIQENLKPGETVVDRPDLVATVFHCKLREFMKDMTENHVLGRVKAYQSVIEFQKRGLPHCHMLFILETEDKVREPDEVDTVVCAEIPDKEQNPVLYDIVASAMIHGPCGALNYASPCMEKVEGTSVCTKNYPKEFLDTTNVNKDGYPEYRRREDGKTVTKGNHLLDNRWVVPYNPYLCQKYNAHINVEVCSTVKSVKYIFKYIYKGHDAAIVKIGDSNELSTYNWDEIRIYIDTRYVSPPEAMWRIREYRMQDRSHTIIRLAVHLPLQQNVVFSEEKLDQAELTSALARAQSKGTTLTQWFKLNQEDPEARRYSYNEIPLHYTFDKDDSTWKRRKRMYHKTLSRLYSVNPKDLERYSLRLLLLHIKGATCFADLRTFEGVIYETFHEAAKAMNLIESDEHWFRTLDEALIFQMPAQLRTLFATILQMGDVGDPKVIYLTYREHLMEDYKRSMDAEAAENMCLLAIESYLSQFEKTCKDFGLPAPKPIEEYFESDIDHDKEAKTAQQLIPLLNSEQLTCFNEVMESVDSKSAQKLFFLSGAGGTGKTFLYKTLISYIVGRKQNVKVVAPTGLAATLLQYGQTVHSGFKMPLNVAKTSRSNIRQGSKLWKQLKNTKLIIWDEISMCTSDMLTAVDQSLRDLLDEPRRPFGGITVVVGGDFRQQAPVIKHANRVKIIEACVKSNPIWPQFKVLSLSQNMRVNASDLSSKEWLLNVGSGLSESGDVSDFVCIPDSMLSTDIVMTAFGENPSSLSKEQLAGRAILCPTNDETLRINQSVLEKINGEKKTFYSIDTITDCESEEERQQYPVEFLNSLTPNGMPEHKLSLKEGCCVMLLRNLNAKLGLCNGTRLIVEKMGHNVIDCSIFSSTSKGARVFIPRLSLDSQDPDIPFKFKRKQFPLRLAYSMTITKSQGQTFEQIGLYLPQPVFTHGQLYTAFSRVKSREGLSVQVKPTKNQGKIFENDENCYTYNCVFQQLLC